jgi:hypothetical protein
MWAKLRQLGARLATGPNRIALSGGGEASPGRSVATLLDQVVSDATGLILAPVAARPSA